MQFNKYQNIILACISLLSISGQAQERELTLEEAFILAEKQSLEASIVRNTFLNSFWQYRNYKAELLPNIVLDGTLPALNRSLEVYQKEDGSYGFVKNNTLTETLSLSIEQNIPFTGGVLSIQSQLHRIDQLDSRTTGYLTVPFSVTLQQPLFHPQTLKWAMRIEPEKYKEAMKQFKVNMETVYLNVINYYFDLLLAMVNLDMATVNLNNAVKLFEIAKGKRNLGLISQNELYQLELGRINAESEVVSVRQTYKSKLLTLRNYLRMENSDTFRPSIPRNFNWAEILPERVKQLAYKNNPIAHSVNRKIMEAQMRIDEAKANRGFKADILVSLGNTGSNPTLSGAYRNLQNREMVSLGIRIPVLDWGKGKGGVKLAESEREVIKRQTEQSQLNFEQNITLTVSQFHTQSKQVQLAHYADSIAQLRYETAFQTFLMGTINVLDINAAQVERDNARRKYINELYLTWFCYYTLRQITLFDFINNTEVSYQTEIR
jgi:outer membrane protein TolC